MAQDKKAPIESAYSFDFCRGFTDQPASAGNTHIISFTLVFKRDLVSGCDDLHIGHAGLWATEAGVAEIDGFLGNELNLLCCSTRLLGDQMNCLAGWRIRCGCHRVCGIRIPGN
jgi:hypothetical protein